MSLLLTNVDGFSAQATLETRSSTANPEVVTGQLLGRGGKLVFAQDEDKTREKRLRTHGISFIWDVGQQSGYVLSDALQGYAPFSSSLRLSNIVVHPVADSTERVGGHVCDQLEMSVVSTEGAVAAFQVWRAKDLHGLPVHIASTGNPVSHILTLSKIRLEPPPPDLFQPPDGFTRYDSTESMETEIYLREQNLKRRTAESWSSGDLTTSPGEERPRGSR